MRCWDCPCFHIKEDVVKGREIWQLFLWPVLFLSTEKLQLRPQNHMDQLDQSLPSAFHSLNMAWASLDHPQKLSSLNKLLLDGMEATLCQRLVLHPWLLQKNSCNHLIKQIVIKIIIIFKPKKKNKFWCSFEDMYKLIMVKTSFFSV